MQPEQARFIMDSALLPTLLHEHPITKNTIRAIPEAQLLYRPNHVARTTFELARHIVASERRLIDGIVNGEVSGAPVLPNGIDSIASLLQWYETSFETCSTNLRMLSSEHLARNVKFRNGEQIAVLGLQFVMHHTVHHRGQLAAYIRSMDGRVPSIYGRSYEDEQAITGVRS